MEIERKRKKSFLQVLSLSHIIYIRIYLLSEITIKCICLINSKTVIVNKRKLQRKKKKIENKFVEPLRNRASIAI